MDRTRRSFLKGLACAGATAAASAVPAVASEKREAPADALGMLYDTTLCIGCRLCEKACVEVNEDLPEPDRPFDDESVFQEKRRTDDKTYTVVNRYDNPTDAGKPIYAKVNCLHCNDPACVSDIESLSISRGSSVGRKAEYMSWVKCAPTMVRMPSITGMKISVITRSG